MAFYDGLFNRTPKKVEVKITQPQDEIANSVLDIIHMKGYDMPKPYESMAHDWVLNGAHNKFPLELIDLRNGSSLHSSIIESKARLIAGDGIIFDEDEGLSKRWIIDNFKLVPFWRKLDDVFYAVCRDQQTFGYSCFEVIYSTDHRIVDINWVDASRVACGRRDEFGQIKDFYYSENWANTIKFPPTKISGWDPNDKSDLRQLIFIKYQQNNMDYYSIPNYFAALKEIKADCLMGEYNLSAIQNGFSPSLIITYYTRMKAEEQREIRDRLTRQFGGPRNAGKAIVIFALDKDTAPEIKPIESTNIDSRLLAVSDHITQEIISAHRISPALCGIQVPGKLGYSNELLQSWSIFETLVIQPERKMVLDAFKEVLIYNGVSNVFVKKLDPISIVDGTQNVNDQGL